MSGLSSRVVLIAALCASSAHAAVIEVSPNSDIRAAIAALTPGDELVLSNGQYNFNSRFAVSVVGQQSNPIVIRSKEGASALISMNTTAQNVVEVQGSQYLVLRGLKFTGGSHGIRLMSSSFVTIEDCEIYETGDVAISANSGGTYEGLVIRRNHIHHTNGTGEGMYLGCNNNDCRVLNSTIEANYVHHTNRATVEQGDGIELKEGSAGNVIRNNVIHDTKYPGILTYSARGNGPANIIEGNLVFNSQDYAIQSAADSVIRNNIILGTIGLQRHQAGTPSNQTIVYNTIITTGAGIEVRDVSGAVVIANNAIYSRDSNAIQLISGSTNLVTLAGNVGLGGVSGASGGFTIGKGLAGDLVNAHYNGAPPIDVFPRSGSALIGAGNATYVLSTDFNGTARNGALDAGAYRYADSGNPGWTLAAGFKASTTTPTPAPVVRPNPPTNLQVQ